MPRTLHVPPGRAGQLWLAHRREVARRAVDLLDQKLRILRSERLRRSLVEERTRAAWAAAVRDADAWQLRLAQLGAQRALRLGRSSEPAGVEVRWDQVVGVRYPAHVVVHEPADTEGPDGPGGSAVLTETRRRMAVAVAAAAQQAAALAALRTLEAQEAATRRRLRSIRTRYLPRLEATLRDVEVALEEDERSDILRLRWAAGRGSGRVDAGGADGGMVG
jgi:V/A-type H+-transporting ATPase subunit D